MIIPSRKANAKTLTSLILGALILMLLSPVIVVYSLYVYVAISLSVKRDRQSNTLKLRPAPQKSS